LGAITPPKNLQVWGFCYYPNRDEGMKRTLPVKPHVTTKHIWHCLFGIGFWEPRKIKTEWWEIYLLSFVNEPADKIAKDYYESKRSKK
jgi:hypothetical protein